MVRRGNWTLPNPRDEDDFQIRIIHCATLNGWQLSLEHLQDSSLPIYKWLNIVFKGKIKKIRNFLLGVRRSEFKLVYHTYDSRRSAKGFPDLVLVHPLTGKIIFAELKQEDNYPSTEQRIWLASLSMAAEVNPLVEVYLWKPSQWTDIVIALGGKDSQLFV